MRTINIDLGYRDYSILIEPDILKQIADYLKTTNLDQELYIITDTNVNEIYIDKLLSYIQSSTLPVVFTVPAGEKSKSLSVANDLYTQLLQHGATRKASIIAFGGGVVGDLAGFVAATFMRGVPFVQVPTTILSQVDSSVGGKVGINHQLGKNLIGAFYQPELVLVDPNVLHTLPEREIKAGLAEVIKYSYIWDQKFFQFLNDNLNSLITLSNMDTMVDVLANCCKIKARVVEKDEKESGLRAILNFGHTAGHALEAATQYKYFLHGEAVSHGMRAALQLSFLENRLSAENSKSALKLIDILAPPEIPGDITTDILLQAMKKDKKRSKDGQLWILLDSIGKSVMTRSVSDENVKLALEFMLKS